MKKCTKCNEIKDLSEFGKRSKSKDKLMFKCKKCCSDYRKNYYINNVEKEKEASKLYTELNP